MVSIKCSCGCNTTSLETHKFIDCCVCKKIYLHSCAELSITEIRTIKSKKGVSWSYRNCNILSSDINDLKAAILSLRDDLAARERSAGIDDKHQEVPGVGDSSGGIKCASIWHEHRPHVGAPYWSFCS
ncbi:hypothetical protein Trydic_g9919 [Trypoxylus dichotomus]